MKAVFIHDHNFVYSDSTKLYYDGSGGAFDKNLWERYLAIFDTLTVVGRQIDSLPNSLVVSSTENVKFDLIKGAHGFIDTVKNNQSIKSKLKTIIEQADFVIIRLPSRLGSWAFDICKELNKKYVLEIVGDPFDAYWSHGSLLGKLIAPIEMYRLKRITKNAKNAIFVTSEMLQKTYPCLNNTIGISNVRLKETVEKESVSEFYNKENKVFKIGLIGSFHIKYKGHIEAINAIKDLKNKGYSNIELYLVGTGNPNWVEDLINENGLTNQIKIVGALLSGNEGVFPFIDELDLYIHPSKQEGLPRVIIEAMSRGKVCLGSNVGGTQELLAKQFIHSPGDWKNLSRQIEVILKMSKEEKIEVALNNLNVAQGYLENILQKNRIEFIKRINHESN